MTDLKTPEDPDVIAAAALRDFAQSLRAPSSAAQIRRLLPEIETAIERGATHLQVLATLKENGIEIPLRTFRNELYQARKRTKKGGRKERSTKSDIALTAAPKLAGPVTVSQPEQTEPSVSEKQMTPAEALRHRMAERRKTIDPLARAKSPPKWDYDPLAEPELTFIDKPSEK